MNETHHLPVYADEVTSLGKKIILQRKTQKLD